MRSMAVAPLDRRPPGSISWTADAAARFDTP
jgi:hypothetical protein